MKTVFLEYSYRDWLEIQNELAFYGDQPLAEILRSPKKAMLQYLEYVIKNFKNKQ